MLVRENSFVRFVFTTPHLRVTILHSNPPTNEEWTFTTTTIQHFYDAAEQGHLRLAMCFDLQQMGLLPMKRYMDWAQLFLNNTHRTASCVLATCIVTGSALVRGAVNGFFLMYTPVRPFRMVDSVEDGLAWLALQPCPDATPAEKEERIVLRQRISRAVSPDDSSV